MRTKNEIEERLSKKLRYGYEMYNQDMAEKIDYEKFYERVGEEIGWDFSELKVEKEERKWNLYEKAIKKVEDRGELLDIGCGGGKKILKVADAFDKVVGIDSSKAMIKKAKQNLKEAGKEDVEFKLMDAKSLEFEDESFMVITCRHAPFEADQVYRALKNGGLFITQQVSLGDKRNIKEVFGRGQGWGEEEGSFKKRLLNELEEAGFEDIEVDEYEVDEFYKEAEDVIFLLKHTPIVVDFGKKEGDFDKLEKFIEENKEERGIRTTSKRFMLSGRKR